MSRFFFSYLCPVCYHQSARAARNSGPLRACAWQNTGLSVFFAVSLFISSSKAFLRELRPLVVFVSGSAAGDKVVLF